MSKVNSKFAKRLKEKFDFDVSALPDYTDEQSGEFITDIIESSTFLSKLRLEEGVKGSKTLKLLNADAALQEMTGCTPEPDGSVVFTGRNIETKRLYVGIEFCNEDLNGKYTQMLNGLGASRQDAQMPLEDVILAYLGTLLRRKAQRIAILGDSTSLNPDLVHFDGFKKLIDNDPLVNVAYTTQTAFTASNGYDLLKTLYNAIPSEVFDAGLNAVILTGRTEARAAIDQVWDDKDFNARIETVEEGGQLSFTLPTTDIRVETVPELSGTGAAYCFVYDFAFMGTDLEDDMDSIAIKYDDYDNKLKAEAIFRLGVQFVLPQYFVRLRLQPVS
jgi:hypothetical protein